MNKKEFIKFINSSVVDKEKQMRLIIKPTRGDKLRIECGITLVTPADKLKTIYISNGFSHSGKRNLLTVNQFIDQFPIESAYDTFSVTANVTGFNGRCNSSLLLQELTDNNICILQNNKLVQILVKVPYLQFK